MSPEVFGHGATSYLHCWQGDFLRFREREGGYQTMPIDLIRSQLYSFLEKNHVMPRSRVVSDVVDALRAVCFLDLRDVPAWLDENSHGAAREYLPFTNGILHLPDRKFSPPSPNFFSLSALPVCYDPEAPAPAAWLDFLEETMDFENGAALQEWFGLLLTSRTEFQKAVLLVGPKRSGKGTIARILTALLGSRNVTHPTLAGLAGPFGISCLIGKTAAILSDVRLSVRIDAENLAELVLRVTGEDHLTISRKFQSDWSGRLSTRFMLMSNEVPHLLDASGALASRFVVLETKQSFLGRENLDLTDNLLSEVSGILNWALEGLARLIDRRAFLQPASGQEVAQQLELLGSPIKAFVADRCDLTPGAQVTVQNLYQAWQDWCERQKWAPGTCQTFGRNLAAAEPSLRSKQVRNGDQRERIYQGIGLV